MKYANYQIEDFLTDPEFIRWVKNPDTERNTFWESFLRNNPYQQATVQQARAILLAFQFDEEPVADETIRVEWTRFKESHIDQRESIPVPVIPLRSNRQQWWWAAAAAFAGVIFGLFWLTNQPVPDTIYRTAFGQIRQFRLPDGSELTLNANSEVRLPANWSERPLREVWIKGEGFFHVVKRKGQSQPRFVVHTNELNVHVLGTAFNVRSRHRKAEVLLQTGSVSLQLANADTVRELLMKPGDGIRYQQATGQMTRRFMPVDQMASWTRGILLLDSMTLSELGKVIEDTYGRKVIIRSPTLARRVLSGSLPTQNERVLLEGVAITLNVPVHIDKNTVVFGD